MMDEFGIDDLDRARRAHLRSARARPCWPRSRKLPKGTWRNEMTVDGYDAPVDAQRDD